MRHLPLNDTRGLVRPMYIFDKNKIGNFVFDLQKLLREHIEFELDELYYTTDPKIT